MHQGTGPAATNASPGATKDALDTPSLCVDLDALGRNIDRVAADCAKHKVAWRPHAKGHKVPEIAHRELAAGAIGITCAKLGEAEVMAAAGIRDILIANLIVGPKKLERLAALAKHADPIVCIDHPDQVDATGAAMARAGVEVRALIEVDIGLRRVGAAPGEPTLELARRIVNQPGLQFAGLMGYEGHLLTLPDATDKAQRIRQSLDLLAETRDLLAGQDIDCEIMSCGGTGSYLHAVQHPAITEVQAGGAIFMDVFYRTQCQVTHLENALTVLATVVSRPTADRAVVDTGRKSMNIELEKPCVVGREDMRVTRLSAEHGELELGPTAQSLRVGDRLEFIPGYADLTTLLHEEMFGFRGPELEVVWPIVARGKLR